MLNRIIRFSVENNIYVILITVIFIAAGIYSYRTIAIDAVPDITNIQVQVNTPVTAMTPDTVEANVTYPIENAMSSVPGARAVRSISRYGLSQVTVVFDDGTDIYRARQLIQEKIQSLELPEGAHPQLGPISTGLGEILHYTIEAKIIEKDPEKRTRQLMELRTVQQWEVIPRLMSVKGVAEINTIGGYPLQYHVIPDIRAMNRYGLRYGDIADVLKKNNYNSGGGYIQQTSERMLVQGYGIFKSLDDIRKVPVKILENFETITIGDIASVAPGRETLSGAALINGREGIIGTVIMLMGANSREVSMETAEKLDEIKKSLPGHMDIRILYSRSHLVDLTLTTVQKNLLFGALLVIIILFLLIGNIRAALITSITIPLALMGTFIFMKLTGISVSLMSLGALDFGIIIDGAVIVIDSCIFNISLRASEAGKPLSRAEIRETVINSSVDIRRAAGFGQLIIIIVFLPVMALTGIEGRMFKPMALSFCFALITAFILSFTFVPSMAGLFLSGKERGDETFLMKILKKLYKPALDSAFRKRKYFISCAAASLVLAMGIFVMLGGEFIPRLKEGTLSIQFVRPLTINAEKSAELERLSHEIILEFKEVAGVFSRMGTPEITVHAAGIYHGDTAIMLKPKSQWPLVNGSRRSYDGLAKDIHDRLIAAVPGQRFMMTQPIELLFNELLEGVKSDISLKIFGENMDRLEELSKKAAAIIKGIRSSGDVEVELRGKTPILQVIPKPQVLNRYGISKSDILDAVKIALGGEKAGSLYRDVKRFPIIVRLPESIRRDINAIKMIPVGIDDYLTVPLSSLAELKIVDMHIAINRENSSRRSAVLINPRGRDTEGFVREAKRKIQKSLKLPPGYYLQWGGNFKNLQTAKERLFFLAPLCLAGVFLLIFSAFRRFRYTLLVFSTVPFALVGGIVSLAVLGLPFSISAGIGFIALSGIAVLHSLVLVTYFNRLLEEGQRGINVIKKGALMRLRPVMMTAFTDIFGFLPMMLAVGTGAEVQKPLAAVVVGGIFSSTIITLFLIPILFSFIEKKIEVNKYVETD